jgi:tRNA C32,U32 (ribose-2'-O)-methylase TrmJ
MAKKNGSVTLEMLLEQMEAIFEKIKAPLNIKKKQGSIRLRNIYGRVNLAICE